MANGVNGNDGVKLQGVLPKLKEKVGGVVDKLESTGIFDNGAISKAKDGEIFENGAINKAKEGGLFENGAISKVKDGEIFENGAIKKISEHGKGLIQTIRDKVSD